MHETADWSETGGRGWAVVILMWLCVLSFWSMLWDRALCGVQGWNMGRDGLSFKICYWVMGWI